MVKDQEFLEKKASYCLGLAKKLGATESSVIVDNSVSETVNFRNKKLDESNRSDNLGINITTYIDHKKSSISSSNFVDSLSTGSYFVEIMDANGCDTFTTVQVISSQLPLTASPQVYGVSCRGDSTGMIIADGGGSSAPYKYYWMSSSGDTLRYTGLMIGRDTLRDLFAGTYRLHIYDSQECFEDYILTVGEPATSLSIDSLLTVLDIACYGDSVGSARMYVSGGMPNYSYLWESGETDLIATSLKAGYNTISVTDAWGCTLEDSIQINENPLIGSTVSVVQDVSCYANSDGIASVTSSGGIPSYIYFWSNGHTGFSMPDTANNLLFGSYYVTTRDALGCEVVDSIDISQPEPLSMEASEIEWISCYGANDGLASAYAWGVQLLTLLHGCQTDNKGIL